MVQWLNPEERAAWLALGGMLMKLPNALDAQLHRDANLTFFEYMVLAMLSEQDDRTLRMSELATATNASPSRLSHVARRLEAQGFLTRARDYDDARSINATLTDEGWDKVVEAAPGHVQRVRELVIDNLTKAQLRDLRSIGARVMPHLDPDWCPPE